MLMLIALFAFRLRIKKMELTVMIDCLVCILMLNWWEYARYALLIVVFEAFATKKYLMLLAVIYFYHSPEFLLLFLIVGLGGYFLGGWQEEKETDLKQHFGLKAQIYELEALTDEINFTAVQDARLAAISERARISREIHDNAGHDIIAAYMSFQTLRNLITDEQVLEMYDVTLQRLSDGVDQIRNILHNIMPAEIPGVDQLDKICNEFPLDVSFNAYGNMELVPAYVWNTLAICLKESLTNASRHATPDSVKVEVDVSAHIVRLYVENDGARHDKVPAGRGLTNLRYRISAVGGNLSTNKQDGIFKLICVVPLVKEVLVNDENTLS